MKDMLELAAKARECAYAPYSGFKVGACVKAGSGRLYAGCNVENSSYGLSICAERAAVFSAVACGETELKELLLVTQTLAMPCGACRQVMREFGIAKVYVADLLGESACYSLEELLPHTFGKGDF